MIALLWRDVWSPIWPNVAATLITVPAALWWHHGRMRRHVTAEMDRLHDNIIRHFEGEGPR